MKSRNYIFCAIILLFYSHLIHGQVLNVDEEIKVKTTTRNYCTFDESIFFPSSEEDNTKYQVEDYRIYTKSGRWKIIKEALKNIFVDGRYLEKCSYSVGLNLFNLSISDNDYYGRLDRYRNDYGEISFASFNISFSYDQVQRKHNVAGQNEIEVSNITYPEDGYVYNVGYFDDEIFVPKDALEEVKLYSESYGGWGDNSVNKNEMIIEYNSHIKFFPFLFESSGFYMEGEKRWAKDIIEAVEYVILHELGHLESKISNTIKNNRYPELGTSEESADDFAFSVWRCKRH